MGLRTQKKRRRTAKTDYKLRTSLLKSGVPRIVIRLTNKHFIVQVVESVMAQDKVTFGVTSKDLLEHGWDKKYSGSLRSLPAGYLTGLLLAKKLSGKGKFIIDVGMARTLLGSRIFSVVKGLIDGGLHISADAKAFPSPERLLGEHLKSELKSMIVKVKSQLVK